MRQGQQNRRGRGRSNNSNSQGHGHSQSQNRRGQNPLSRNFESNGPGVKIRGNAAHVAEKYMSLARDAQSSGDNVMAENYLQHAEHYNRIIMSAQQPADGMNPGGGAIARPRPLPGEFGASEDDGFGDGDETGQGMAAGQFNGGVGSGQASSGQGGQGGQGGSNQAGYPAQGQQPGYGQQNNRNGYGQRGERFPRERDGRDRDGRDRETREGRDRDGGHQRMPQRQEPRHEHPSRRDQGRGEHGRGEHGRHEQARHDQPRQDQFRHDQQRQDHGRQDHNRHSDFGRQPQPMVEHAPIASTGFDPASGPLPGFIGGPSIGHPEQVYPVAPMTSEPDQAMDTGAPHMPADGESGSFRRERPERTPRPVAGEEGYRAPRRRRAPVAAGPSDGVPSALPGDEPEPAPRRKPETDVSGE